MSEAYFDSNLGVLFCPVCGASEPVVTPLPVADFVDQGQRFQRDHRHPPKVVDTRPLHVSVDPFTGTTICGLKKDDALPYCSLSSAIAHGARRHPHVCPTCFAHIDYPGKGTP